jgi:hypothetical protein
LTAVGVLAPTAGGFLLRRDAPQRGGPSERREGVGNSSRADRRDVKQPASVATACVNSKCTPRLEIRKICGGGLRYGADGSARRWGSRIHERTCDFPGWRERLTPNRRPQSCCRPGARRNAGCCCARSNRSTAVNRCGDSCANQNHRHTAGLPRTAADLEFAAAQILQSHRSVAAGPLRRFELRPPTRPVMDQSIRAASRRCPVDTV